MPISFKSLFGYNSTLFMLIAGMLAYMAIQYDGFMSLFNIETLGMGFVTEAIMALGMTMVILIAGIDLSIASILPFTAILVGILMQYFTGMGFSVAWVITLAVSMALSAAAVIGVINGFLINLLKMHPFIITLAMMLTLRGINLVITDGGTVYGFPDEFAWLGQGEVGGIPVPLLLFGALALVFGYLLANHRYFQQSYFIGGNLRSAQFSGINIQRFSLITFVISALLAGVAGLVTASQYGAASVSYGQNAELRVIASVIIGGASLFGGKGSIGGTCLGVLFLATVYNAFTWTGINTYYQEIIIGSMLLFAVITGEFIRRRSAAYREIH